MRLQIRRIEYPKTALAEWLSGVLPTWEVEQAPSLEVYRISSAPSTGHSLLECRDCEQQWRSSAADVLTTFKGEHRNCVIWAHGPFNMSGILPLLSYVEHWNAIGLCYHVEGFTYPGGRGYYTSWISFEFEHDNCRQIMNDNTIDFESARLAAAICEPAMVNSIIATPFDSMEVLSLLQQHGMILASPRHFEGFDVAGLKDVLRAPIATLKGWSDPSDR